MLWIVYRPDSTVPMVGPFLTRSEAVEWNKADIARHGEFFNPPNIYSIATPEVAWEKAEGSP